MRLRLTFTPSSLRKVYSPRSLRIVGVVAAAGLLLGIAGCSAGNSGEDRADQGGIRESGKPIESDIKDDRRDHALAMAKQYGHLEIDNLPAIPKRVLVSLSNRRAVDKVLPLLTAVPDLTVLGIDRVKLTKEDFRSIGELTHLPTLRLKKCDFDEGDLTFLSGLTNLNDLDLTFCALTDDGLKHLSEMANLRRLDLMFTKVQGAGLEHITPQLNDLTLTGTLLDDDTIVHCTRFRRLHTLYFGRTMVTHAGLMKLTELHWLLTIGPPDDIPKDFVTRFRSAQETATETARAAGEEVPPGPPAPARKEVL